MNNSEQIFWIECVIFEVYRCQIVDSRTKNYFKISFIVGDGADRKLIIHKFYWKIWQKLLIDSPTDSVGDLPPHTIRKSCSPFWNKFTTSHSENNFWPFMASIGRYRHLVLGAHMHFFLQINGFTKENSQLGIWKTICFAK
jgi:hypothetical protein